MIGVFEWNVTSYATEWFVPVVDLVEIYKWDQKLKPGIKISKAGIKISKPGIKISKPGI